MSERRIIWKKAVIANTEMINDRNRGEKSFDKLIKKYKKDGMVLYERGEAYEFLKDYKNALLDYEKAIPLLPMSHWQDRSKDGLLRLEMKKRGDSVEQSDGQWEIYHRLHEFNNIEPLTKFDMLVAITLLDSTPHETALLLRCCLETMLISWSINNSMKINGGLANLINSVFINSQHSLCPLDETTYQMMIKVNEIGTKAAHPKLRTINTNFEGCARYFIHVVEWMNRALEE